MITERGQAEKLASKMLAEHGIAAIWDIHVAAAAAYGLGRTDVATSLIEVAEAAEREWLKERPPSFERRP